MASSKVMVSTAPTNPDLPRYVRNHNSSSAAFSSQYQNPIMFPSTDQLNGGLGSINMDDVLNTMYSEPTEIEGDGGGGGGEVGWGEIGNGGQGVVGENNEAMTLETFLTKAGAVTEEDIRVPGVVDVAGSTTGNYGMEGLMGSVQYQGMGMQNCSNGGFGVEGFGNGMVGVGGTSGAVVVASGGGGRGKRRAVEDVPLDKATQQRQKRMIKNRESAARSRERKQAYTVELEALVTKLEEENARLIKEEAELKTQRFKQLIEKVKPVVEERRPPKAVMRRSRSMDW